MLFPFFIKPRPQLIRRECVLPDFLLILVAWASVFFRRLCLLPGSDGAEVRVDHGQDVKDVRQDRVCLDRASPCRQLRIQLPRRLAVYVQMTQKSTERTPRESAPDVFQAAACFDQQVFFNSLTVFCYELREAFDSPSLSFPSLIA